MTNTLLLIVPLQIFLLIFMLMTGRLSWLEGKNRENIQRVTFGDSDETVKVKMSESKKSFFNVANPYKRDSFKSNDKDYEIWYYATDRVGTKDWKDEVTPVVFESGRVAAIGWKSLNRLGYNALTLTH
jgi:Protein of unknown function (DUF3192)